MERRRPCRRPGGQFGDRGPIEDDAGGDLDCPPGRVLEANAQLSDSSGVLAASLMRTASASEPGPRDRVAARTRWMGGRRRRACRGTRGSIRRGGQVAPVAVRGRHGVDAPGPVGEAAHELSARSRSGGASGAGRQADPGKSCPG